MDSGQCKARQTTLCGTRASASSTPWKGASMRPLLRLRVSRNLNISDPCRYTTETKRLYAVLDEHLKDKDYIVGGKLSYADITAQPW